MRSAICAIDGSPVVRNWLFGWYIVEYELRREVATLRKYKP